MSLQRAPDSPPQALLGFRSLRSPSFGHAPPPRTQGGEGERGASKCLGKARGAPAAARPYLGSKACPRRARRREAPAAAGRPKRARGRPRRGLPCRTASAAPRPAGLPPSAALVGTTLCPRPRSRFRGWDVGQARGGDSRWGGTVAAGSRRA